MDDAHGKLSRYLEIDIGIWKRATNTRVDRSTAVSLSLSAPPATLKWKRVRCCEERVISSNRLAPCVDPRSLARSPISNHSFPVPARGSREIRSTNSDFTTLLSSCPSIPKKNREKHETFTPRFFLHPPPLPFSSSFLPGDEHSRDDTISPQSRHERRTDWIVTIA